VKLTCIVCRRIGLVSGGRWQLICRIRGPSVKRDLWSRVLGEELNPSAWIVGHSETEPKGFPFGSDARHTTKRCGLFRLEIVKRFRNNFGTLRTEQQLKRPALQSLDFPSSDCVGLPSVPRVFARSPTLPCCYCCLLLPRGFRKSSGVNKKTGRGGGGRTHDQRLKRPKPRPTATIRYSKLQKNKPRCERKTVVL